MSATYAGTSTASPDTNGAATENGYDGAVPEGSHSLVAEAVTALDLTGRMTRHPYQTMLIAAGVGYILGGGLFTRLTANVFRMGLRIGGHPMVQRELFGVAEAALRGRSDQSS